jgi:hypothetical protein
MAISLSDVVKKFPHDSCVSGLCTRCRLEKLLPGVAPKLNGSVAFSAREMKTVRKALLLLAAEFADDDAKGILEEIGLA